MKKYDTSADYSCYPTLAPLPEELLGQFARCERCGSMDFRFRLPDWTAVCKKCSRPIQKHAAHTPAAPVKKRFPAFVSSGDFDMLLRKDGTLRTNGKMNDLRSIIEGWTNIVSVARGDCGDKFHAVGLSADGTVKAAGSDLHGQCNVQKWQDITAITAGSGFTVGLRSDGTLVCAGSNKFGQCDFRDWRNITAIAAYHNHTVGLCLDGTVKAVGNNCYGQCNTSQWTQIASIAASSYHTVGLRKDGTVCAVGNNRDGQCNVQSWRNIIAIDAANHITVGLCADGTVKATGSGAYGPVNLDQWNNVVSIFTHFQYSLGIRKDGTILCTDPTRRKWIEAALG